MFIEKCLIWKHWAVKHLTFIKIGLQCTPKTGFNKKKISISTERYLERNVLSLNAWLVLNSGKRQQLEVVIFILHCYLLKIIGLLYEKYSVNLKSADQKLCTIFVELDMLCRRRTESVFSHGH